MRGSVNAIAKTTLKASKQSSKPPPAKRRKTAASTKKSKTPAKQVESQESFHFIGYVPCEGKIWELDGLKSGPLEVGEIPPESEGTWMDVARPALRMKMQKFGGGGIGEIRFNLLALVPDQYLKFSDQLELLKRERTAIERRMVEEFSDAWSDQV
jgi:ubiquitin carboxyl-terminal hydrolase L5